MISISRCVDYVECSYRDKFHSQVPELSIHHAKTIAIAESVKLFLMRAGEGKTVSTRTIKKAMSVTWNRTKRANHFKYDWTDLIAMQNSMIKSVDKMLGPGDTVLAVNFPVSFNPFSEDIIVGSIDGAILKEVSASQRYLDILLFDYTTFARRTVSTSLLRFTAGLYDLAIRGSKVCKVSRRYSFLRLNNASLQSISIKCLDDKQVLSVLSSVLDGIKAGVQVPTTDSKICKDCLYQNFCDWYQG